MLNYRHDCLHGLNLEPFVMYVPIQFLQAQTVGKAPDSLGSRKNGEKTQFVLLVATMGLLQYNPYT